MPLDGQHVNSLASGTSTAHMKQSYSSLMIMPWPGRSGPLHLDDVFFHVVNTGEGLFDDTKLQQIERTMVELKAG